MSNRQHAACPACTIVASIGSILDLSGNRHKDEVGHQFDGVARREVLSGFLVVFLVESPDQLLENHAHGVVVQPRQTNRAIIIQNRIRAEVDGGRNKLLNDRAEDVGIDHSADLIPEFELVQNLLHVGRKAVEIGFEVALELLSLSAGFEVFQAEWRTIAERLASNETQ